MLRGRPAVATLEPTLRTNRLPLLGSYGDNDLQLLASNQGCRFASPAGRPPPQS